MKGNINAFVRPSPTNTMRSIITAGKSLKRDPIELNQKEKCFRLRQMGAFNENDGK